MIRILMVLSVLLSGSAVAADTPVGPPDLAITTMLGSLLLVLACIFVFAYLMKQTNLLKNGRGKSQIKVIANQPLTNKGRVQMIEVNGQQYLLGVTEQNITLLDKLDTPLAVDDGADQKQLATPFSTWLATMKKKSND